MAQETKCLTSGAQFHIHIRSDIDSITAEVDLPTGTLESVDKKEAELLSRLIHNQLELVLRPYFENKKAEKLPRAKIRLV
tara:strand:+ start:293 stop:532 length:240 start_codon:yes stop_codon:yes gene_type:complete